jgi:hypothetical protein
LIKNLRKNLKLKNVVLVKILKIGNVRKYYKLEFI